MWHLSFGPSILPAIFLFFLVAKICHTIQRKCTVLEFTDLIAFVVLFSALGLIGFAASDIGMMAGSFLCLILRLFTVILVVRNRRALPEVRSFHL